MRDQSVCAVVVTYHPNAEAAENISSISAQVEGLVVVDNGSSADEVGALRDLGQKLGCHLIENAENLGLAEGLNQGANWAKSRGYSWVVLFDQDSVVTDKLIDHLLAAWESHPERHRIASIHPTYVDPDTRTVPRVRRAKDGGPILSISSGQMLPTWIFDKIGLFASEYFIDCVDFEYCFRIRAAGYLIVDSREAVLLHAAGNAQEATQFLRFRFRPTHHNRVRRYYMSRNRVLLYRKYFRVFPRWVLQSMYDSMRETIKCFVSEGDRVQKFRSFLLGTWDGLNGRMGRHEGL